MRAVVYDRYGPPEVLRLEDIPLPHPAPDQVLVRVAAVSINRADWEMLLGRPLYARIGGWRHPARPTLGTDIAGTVSAVGSAVTAFRTGDEVYGRCRAGGFAEYAAARAGSLSPKPAELSFAEASTIPEAGAIAVQGTAGVGPSDRVLINGGGGGSGTFAIQLASLAGAHVTAVDNAEKLDFMRSVGAHEVLDHRRHDYTREGPFDLVLDLVAHRSVFAYRRALAPGGRFHYVGGSVPTLLSMVTVGRVVGKASGRTLGLLVVGTGPAHYESVAERCVTGEVHIHIDRAFALEDTPAALAYVGEGRALGKVVVTPER